MFHTEIPALQSNGFGEGREFWLVEGTVGLILGHSEVKNGVGENLSDQTGPF
jgi:hypothetical protein